MEIFKFGCKHLSWVLTIEVYEFWKFCTIIGVKVTQNSEYVRMIFKSDLLF